VLGNASRALSGPVTTAPGGGWCCGLWHGLRATAEDGTHFGLLRGVHIDFTTRLAAGDPLLTSAGTDAVITILHDGGTGDDSGTGDGQAAGTDSSPACQTRTPGVKVQVSQTFTLITSLRDVAAFPAAGIAALYSDRWSIELVFSELKVTVMTAGSTCRSPKPAGACQELLAAITLQTSLRLPGAHYAAQAGVPPGRISFTNYATPSSRA
jgi:hypothetical protein